MKTDRMCRMILILLSLCFFVACGGGAASYVDPRNKAQADALRDLGKEYYLHGNYANALRELLQAEKLNPGGYLIQDYLGLTYQKIKRYDEAVRHFKKAAQLNPDYGPAVNNLGTVYLDMKDWDAAITCLIPMVVDRRFDIYLTPHLPRLNLGVAYFEKRDYAQAEKYYRQALQYYLDGFNKDIHYIKIVIGLGRTLRATGKATEAVTILTDAIKTAPNLPILHYEIGSTYRETGDDAKALVAFNNVVALAPDSEIATAAQKEIAAIGKGE